jgi:hypothetical protein
MKGATEMAIITEKDVERTLILHASQCGSTLFKNNVGKLRDNKGNIVTFGLCKGSSDLIGWTPVTITPEMVGKKVAVFTAIEVKKNKFGKYRATDEQKHFITAVKNNGGMAGVADCMADLERIIHV